jgi:hypothetical protein
MSKKKKPKWKLLSHDMMVAAEVYKFNSRGKTVWFTNLVESLRGVLSGATIQKSLTALTDWGIVKVQFGETETGRAGRLLFIAGEAKNTIAQVYEEYWKGRERDLRPSQDATKA